MVNTSPLLAAKHLTWVPEESTAHEQFCEGKDENGTVDLQVIPQFLSSSGQPRRSLREMWGVANPVLKSTLSLDGFCLSRCLIVHFQVMRDDQAKSQLLAEGGQPLAAFLKARCMSVPPLSLPPAIQPKFQKNSARSVAEWLSVVFFFLGNVQRECGTSAPSFVL